MTDTNTTLRRHGGERSRTYFAGLLGLDRADDYQVRAVDLGGKEFEVAVKPRDGQDLRLAIASRQQMRQAYLSSLHLALSFKAGESPIPSQFEKILQQSVPSRFGKLTFQVLEQVMDNDPDTWSDPSPKAPKPVLRPAKKPAQAKLQPVAGPDFSNFLAREDILCQKIISLWGFNPVTLIQLGDRECFGLPHLGLSMVMVINAPWDNHLRDRRRPADAPARYTEPTPDNLKFYFSDLREQDVIAGSDAKERAVCDYAFRQKPGVVIFFHACVSVVTGSNLQRVYEHYKKKHNMPVLYFRGGDNQNLKDFFRELLVDLRLKTKRSGAAGSRPVNLVGYTGMMTADLLASLKALGIEVNGLLLPTIDVGAITRFEQGGLSVMLPNTDFQSYYEQLVQDSRVPLAIAPDAPYGWEGTKRWLALLAEKTGKTARLKASLAAVMAGRQERWRELAKRAGSYTLGIVVRDSEAEQFVDSAYTYGVPVLSALQEMGFGLEIFIHSANEQSAAKARAVLETRLKKSARVSYSRFNSFESMMRCLCASKCRAVFSNYFFDWRVTSAGKAIFSLQHFEAGFDGAIRTVERLIQACETGYYRRYGRFLQRDKNGEPRWMAKAF
ncbi:MAG: hypothetical protein NTY77_15880 [Elusimicrobia bacterium]|nr:hypothetical protein [Elusimicrobiota bacterium]